MNDLISRQAAIDYFVTNVGFHDEDGYPIEDSGELRKIWTEYFDGIPSAESEQVRTQMSSADCISRQAAIDAVCRACANSDDYVDCVERRQGSTFCDEIVALRKIPSAQPEIIRCKDCIKREICRTSTTWAVAPDDDWYCGDAERRTDERSN